MVATRVRIVLTVIATTVLAFYGVAGSSRLSGPVLFSLSLTHGVHRDDLIVVACWLAVVGLSIWEWRKPHD